MEYTIQSLAKLACISTRTLRYYDQIGLLKPQRVSSSGYRIYGKKEVELLQQILFYKELEFSLEKIKSIILDKDFNIVEALQAHKANIIAKQQHLQILLQTIDKTLQDKKGEYEMQDRERFEGFKEKLISDNEDKYGAEVRDKYGNAAVDASNDRVRNMTQEQWKETEELSREINEMLAEAVQSGDPAGEKAMKLIEIHRKWLQPFGEYPDEVYLNLTQMYVDDERFKAYYDAVIEGGAEFLRDAAQIAVKNRKQ